MSCDKIQDLLRAYIDQELTTEQTALVEEHLLNCHECRELLAMFQMIPEAFSEATAVAAPQSIRQNVMAKIKSEAHPKVVKRWNWRRVAAAFVLFCLSFATGLLPLIDMYATAEDPMMLEFAAPDTTENRVLTTDDKAVPPENSGSDQAVGAVSDPDSTSSLDVAGQPPTEALEVAGSAEIEIDDPAWYEKLPKEPLLFAVTGMFFALLLLWTARPL